MDLIDKKQEVKLNSKCLENMDLFNIPEEIRKFCLDAINLEYDISSICFQLKGNLLDYSSSLPQPQAQSSSSSSSSSSLERSNIENKILFLKSLIESTVAGFKNWNQTLELNLLIIPSLPNLSIKSSNFQELKAPCSLKYQEFSIQEGELIEIIDRTQNNVIKVKVGKEREGTIPILSLIIPSSDADFGSLLERLRVQLLCSWFECFRLFFRQIFALVLSTLEFLKYKCPSNMPEQSNGPKTSKDLKILRKLMARLEYDYITSVDSRSNEVKVEGEGQKVIEAIIPKDDVKLVKELKETYSSYSIFEKMFKALKAKSDDGKKSRPICIFDRLAEFKEQVSGGSKPVKYYKTKITIESVETKEEIMHYPTTRTQQSGIHQSNVDKQTSVKSEQLSSSSQEVKQKFIIKYVKDPRDGRNISLEEAIQSGIMDVNRGFYVNPVTMATKPIPTAMNEGLIIVETVTEVASKPKVEELGMITVKSLIGEDTSKEYKIISTIDPLTAEKLSSEEAAKRGWLKGETYKTGDNEEMPIEEAVEMGWIQADIIKKVSDDSSPNSDSYETRNYLVRSVVDTRNKRTISFSEAVSSGIIDIDNGRFIDSRGGEKISIGEALKRGFIKGRLVEDGEDHSTLTVDPGNILVAKNLGKLKKVVGAFNALTKNASSNVKDVKRDTIDSGNGEGDGGNKDGKDDNSVGNKDDNSVDKAEECSLSTTDCLVQPPDNQLVTDTGNLTIADNVTAPITSTANETSAFNSHISTFSDTDTNGNSSITTSNNNDNENSSDKINNDGGDRDKDDDGNVCDGGAKNQEQNFQTSDINVSLEVKSPTTRTGVIDEIISGNPASQSTTATITTEAVDKGGDDSSSSNSKVSGKVSGFFKSKKSNKKKQPKK